MNYYPFHIGDFAAHTSHLSWEEDIAYRRMLDWYYLNEKALPAEALKIGRLIRMPKSIATVESILSEFFVLSDDGWHNKRADAELTAMLSKQEQQNTKDAHESERMRRFRERRAAMFAALREVNIVPAWDVPIKELQHLFDVNCNAPATHLQREQVVTCNGDATAIPIPTPTPVLTVDKSTGDKSPADPIFGTGLKFLTGKGLDEKLARSFLGKLRKDAGDIVTIRALSDAVANDISDPIPWLTKATKSPSAVPERKPWN